MATDPISGLSPDIKDVAMGDNKQGWRGLGPGPWGWDLVRGGDGGGQIPIDGKGASRGIQIPLVCLGCGQRTGTTSWILWITLRTGRRGIHRGRSSMVLRPEWSWEMATVKTILLLIWWMVQPHLRTGDGGWQGRLDYICRDDQCGKCDSFQHDYFNFNLWYSYSF